MSSNDNDSDVMEHSKRGRRAPSGGRVSMMQMLWADLRKRPVESDPSDDELAYMEMEAEVERWRQQGVSGAHNMPQTQVDQMARRYGSH